MLIYLGRPIDRCGTVANDSDDGNDDDPADDKDERRLSAVEEEFPGVARRLPSRSCRAHVDPSLHRAGGENTEVTRHRLKGVEHNEIATMTHSLTLQYH